MILTDGSTYESAPSHDRIAIVQPRMTLDG